jgi:protein RecA
MMPVSLKKHDGSSEVLQIISAIQKEKGDRVITKANAIPPVQRLATGLFEFDLATGGGFPKARVSQIYGPEGSGKSNLAYLAVAAMQREPGPNNKVVWVDLEGTFDPSWVGQFGVDLDQLYVVTPGYGEEAVDMIIGLMQARDVGLVVVDSLAMITAQKELEKSVESADVGTAAILIKRLCNKIAAALADERNRDHFPTLIFINQTRMKIGVMFGDPETYPGGNTIRFLLSLNVRLYAKAKMDKDIHPDLPVFRETSVILKKAKVRVRQVKTSYDMVVYPHKGLKIGQSDSFKAVLDHLKAHEKVEATKGGWLYDGVKYPNQEALREAYLNTPGFAAKMQADVVALLGDKTFFIQDETEKAANKATPEETPE